MCDQELRLMSDEERDLRDKNAFDAEMALEEEAVASTVQRAIVGGKAFLRSTAGYREIYNRMTRKVEKERRGRTGMLQVDAKAWGHQN